MPGNDGAGHVLGVRALPVPRGTLHRRPDAKTKEKKLLLDAVTIRHSMANLEDMYAVLDEIRGGNDLLTDRALFKAMGVLAQRLYELRLEARQARLF
jgi:hypothetical protein